MIPGQSLHPVEPEEVQGTLFGDDLDIGQTGPLISEVPIPHDQRPGPIRWLHASSHDRLIWDRLYQESTLLKESIGASRAIPTAESLLADLWICFYRSDVHWIPGANDDGRTAAHRPILERLLASPAHARIRPAVNGREELAALAADATIRRISAAITPDVAEFLTLEEEFFVRRDEIESERQSIADLIERKVRARRPVITDKPKAPETLTAERSDHRSEASMTTIATVGAQSRRAFWECDIIECDDQLFTSTLESAEKRLDRHAGVIHLTRREYQ